MSDVVDERKQGAVKPAASLLDELHLECTRQGEISQQASGMFGACSGRWCYQSRGSIRVSNGTSDIVKCVVCALLGDNLKAQNLQGRERERQRDSRHRCVKSKQEAEGASWHACRTRSSARYMLAMKGPMSFNDVSSTVK